jgi:hypothetical protein
VTWLTLGTFLEITVARAIAQ